jgi:hypothetical protein
MNDLDTSILKLYYKGYYQDAKELTKVSLKLLFFTEDRENILFSETAYFVLFVLLTLQSYKKL